MIFFKNRNFVKNNFIKINKFELSPNICEDILSNTHNHEKSRNRLKLLKIFSFWNGIRFLNKLYDFKI